jgi:hypothetical protein
MAAMRRRGWARSVTFFYKDIKLMLKMLVGCGGSNPIVYGVAGLDKGFGAGLDTGPRRA